ncbi:MAG: hypothetical protein ACO3R3_11095 [Ilumatobacteraceae bacterium]
MGSTEPTRPMVGAPTPGQGRECMSCGSHLATAWSTPEGTAWLCRECATLHGLGCP